MRDDLIPSIPADNRFEIAHERTEDLTHTAKACCIEPLFSHETP